MLTIQEAIEAYATIARSEFKSEKTIAWVETSARSFERFVGPTIAVGDLGLEHVRGWIAALRTKPRYADHPFAKPTTARVSPIAINTYVRGSSCWSPGWYARTSFRPIPSNASGYPGHRS